MPAAGRPRFLDGVRAALRTRHYSPRTEDAYVAWIRRYILFHGKRHPADIGAAEITRFLTWLAVDRHVAAKLRSIQVLPSELCTDAEFLRRV